MCPKPSERQEDSVFCYIDEHAHKNVAGMTAVLIPATKFSDIRRAVLDAHPHFPKRTHDGVLDHNRPEELHHYRFLPGDSDDLRLSTWSSLVEIVAEFDLDVLHLSYEVVKSGDDFEVDKPRAMWMSQFWIQGMAQALFPESLITPVFDAGMAATGRIDGGFAATARRIAESYDSSVLLVASGISGTNVSTGDPAFSAEPMFVDSQTSDLMQLCDNLGGLLRRVVLPPSTPFQAKQAAIAAPIVESGNARALHLELLVEDREGYEAQQQSLAWLPFIPITMVQRIRLGDELEQE